MKTLLIVVILGAIVYSCSRESKSVDLHNPNWNWSDTLKIMIKNDSITSVKPYKNGN
jgi:hypothetical protein